MKKKFSIFIILNLFQQLCYSQKAGKQKIDSLFNVLKTEKEDTAKVNQLNAFAWEVMNSNPDTSILLGTQALKLSEELNASPDTIKVKAGKKGMAKSYFELGWFKYLKAEYPASLDYVKKALVLYEAISDNSGKSRTFGILGIIYRNQGDYPKALNYAFKALKTDEEMGNKSGMASDYVNIGNISLNQSDFPKALDYYFKGLKINEEIKNKKGIANCLANIGNVYLSQHDYSKALECYLKVLKMNEEMNNKNGIAKQLNNIGIVYWNQHEYAKALESYFKALKIDEELGDKTGILIRLSNIGDLYTKTGKFAKAEVVLKKAVNISDSLGLMDNSRQLEESLSQLYDTCGRHELALIHYKKAITLKDSLFNQEKNKEITRKEMNYEFDKKEVITKAEQAKKDVIAQEEIKRQRNIRNSTFAGLAIVLLFSLVVFRQRNKIGREKKRSDQLVVEKEMLIKEIHHRVKNNLEVISSLLELQSEGIVDMKAKAAVIEGQNRVQSIALIHHKLYRNDDVSAVEFKSFVNDLYKQVAGVFKKPGTEIEFQITANETQISIDVAVPLGLIVNELLTNTFKYAMQKEKLNIISIQLASTNAALSTIIYKDNGPGLPVNFDIQKSTSLGMKVIQLLTKQLGGTLHFYNDHGSVFEIPFNNDPKN